MSQSTNHQPEWLVRNVRRVTAADFPVRMSDGPAKTPTRRRKPT